MNEFLNISDLTVSIKDKQILKGLDLVVPKGEVHAIMGPNGSGKSTLANVVMGHPEYTVDSGDVRFEGESILELPTDERARRGIFLSFQYPVALPGVSLQQLIKRSMSLMPGAQSYPTPRKFAKALEEMGELASMPKEMFARSANDGFSGGEKKKGEIVQMGMIRSRMIILDEIDSGLDIDSLKGVAKAINALRNAERSFLIITHYQRILSHVRPDRVHVMRDGRIVRSGDASLAEELEKAGYVEMGVPAI
jgi:Fe-S cluster assembly ATP-binding protein